MLCTKSKNVSRRYRFDTFFYTISESHIRTLYLIENKTYSWKNQYAYLKKELTNSTTDTISPISQPINSKIGSSNDPMEPIDKNFNIYRLFIKFNGFS